HTLLLYILSFFFYCYRAHRDLHSFPTRRSSDLFWLSLVNRNPNMYTLIGLGVGVAYVHSVFAVLLPGIFPASFRMHDGQVGAYFEAAAVIVTLVMLGEVMQLRAMGQTSQAIRQLLALSPN